MAKRQYQFCPGWMDYAAAAHYTCFAERTIKAWHKRGLLPAARVENGHPRFRRSDIDDFLESHKKESLLELTEKILENI